MFLANTQQIREADRIMIEENKFPGLLLMETAGRRATEEILKLYPERSLYLILAGPGNNGGDGLVIARYLQVAGKVVQLLLSHDPIKYKGDAAINYKALSGSGVSCTLYESEKASGLLEDLPKDCLLIDALLGTGISSGLRELIAGMIDYFSQQNLETVAIDLPSGLSADTGNIFNPCLQASHTFTFQLPKLCHYLSPAATFCGETHVLDIGIWPRVVESLGIQRYLSSPEFIRQVYKSRVKESHKGTYGHVLTIGGSAEMAGAAALSSRAALFMGAGLSTAFVPPAAKAAFFGSDSPEVMCRSYTEGHAEHFSREAAAEAVQQLKGKSALIIGPGMDQDPDCAEFLAELLPQVRIPLVMDADALNLLSKYPELQQILPPQTILTPHPGEMKRLTGKNDIQKFRLERAETFAHSSGAIVVLKGAGTVIALPDGRSWVNPTGNSGMATAGSGDVLAGAIAALLAQGYAPEEAAVLAVYLHGKAGDRYAEVKGAEGLTAVKIMEELSPALKEILEST